MKIKLSKSQWEMIGKKAGWMNKSAGGYGRFSEDLADTLEAQVMMGVRDGLKSLQIFQLIKNNSDISQFIQSEGMTDSELQEFIDDHMRMLSLIKK